MEQSSKSEALKKILIPAGVTIVVILIIGLLLYVFAIPFNVYVISKVHTYVVTKIVNVTGINQLLVKGIVIIAFIPLLWVIPHSYKGKHKNTARAIGLLYFGIFFLSLYGLSKDLYFAHSGREILKWYALTPDGVKFFDSPGVDPIYGITLKPVTPEVIRNLKLLQKGNFNPVDPTKVNWFNPITGDPQVWYYQYPDGGFEFYDKPGYHPITGDPLKPATNQIHFEWREKAKTTKTTTPSVRPPQAESQKEKTSPFKLVTADNKFIRAKGLGFEPVGSNMNPAVKELSAKRAAQLVALRNLAEQVYGLKVEGETTVKESMTRSDEVRTSVNAFIQGAKVISQKKLPDGSYEVQVEIDIESLKKAIHK